MTGQKMTEAGLIRAAGIVGCEPALLDAVIKVEAPNGGFDAEGRLVILPEKHQIYRHLPAHLRHHALAKGWVNKKWDHRKQYRGFGSYVNNSSRAGKRRWSYLNMISSIDRQAAYMGTSFGLGQIMGFNFRRCGFETVFEMVEAFQKSEDEQIEAVSLFIYSDTTLRRAFINRDFQVIAANYNGTGQVAYYADRLREAYNRSSLAKERSPVNQFPIHQSYLRLGSRGVEVKALQNRLNALGYQNDPDGIFGKRTEDQLVLFQRHNGLTADGIVGPKSRTTLKYAEPLAVNKRSVLEVMSKNNLANGSAGQIVVGGGAGAVGAVNVLKDSPSAVLEPSPVMPFLDQTVQVAEKTTQITTLLPKLIAFASTYGLLTLALGAIAFGIYGLYSAIRNHRYRRWLG